jgi:limonene-1,2-epoxide hydrolase
MNRQYVRMGGSPESVVRDFLASWSDPQTSRLAVFLADDAVWVDGPNGVHRGSSAVVDELMRQLTMTRDSWIEIDTLLAGSDGTVMVEWHGGFTMRGTPIASKVMVVFDVDQSGRIKQMRELRHAVPSGPDRGCGHSDTEVGAQRTAIRTTGTCRSRAGHTAGSTSST